MKVYKKDVYDFLEKVEAKAIKSVEQKYKNMIKDSKEKRSVNYMKDIRGIITKIEKLYNESEKLFEEHKILYADNANYSNLYYMKYYLTNCLHTAQSINFYDIKEDEMEQQSMLEMKQEINEVKKEYAKLKHYAKNNSAKESYNLLKEIGFDVSSLEQQETSLITKADKSKLFVCGDNK